MLFRSFSPHWSKALRCHETRDGISKFHFPIRRHLTRQKWGLDKSQERGKKEGKLTLGARFRAEHVEEPQLHFSNFLFVCYRLHTQRISAHLSQLYTIRFSYCRWIFMHTTRACLGILQDTQAVVGAEGARERRRRRQLTMRATPTQ